MLTLFLFASLLGRAPLTEQARVPAEPVCDLFGAGGDGAGHRAA